MYKVIKFFASISVIMSGGFIGWVFPHINDSWAVDYWQPHQNEQIAWQWQLTTPVDTSLDVDMYDIDLFDASQSTIDTLHAQGKIVICYFSAGTLEDDRPDSQTLRDISPNVIGDELEDWPDENWLDITNVDVRNVMGARLDVAVNKNCDGVEPDNINGWEEDGDGDSNVTGFNITEAQQIDYNRWIAQQAHTRNLSVGLKNDIGLDTSTTTHLEQLVDYFDWALNEQCYEYNECGVYSVFDDANKAVFGVEYDGSTGSFCPDAEANGRYWMKKRYSLNTWRNACQEVSVHNLMPIYRLYNTRTGMHLYTRGIADRDKILNKYPDFEFTDGVPAFYASTSDDGNTPMYRLYNTRTGAQLYTKGIADRDKILNKFPDFEFTDGGPAFYASTSDDGNTPMYRLYNTRTGAQLYTKGIVDRDKILNKYPDFEFTDGSPAFYAKTL